MAVITMKTNGDSRLDLLTCLRSTLKLNNPSAKAFGLCLSNLISLEQPDTNTSQLQAEFSGHRKNLLALSNHNNLIDQHRAALIEAEYNQLQSNRYRALEQYDNAIAFSKNAGLFTEAAISAELAAWLFKDWNRHNHAVPYIYEAKELYNRADNNVETVYTARTHSNSTSPGQLPVDSHTNYKRLVEDAVDVIWSADKDGYFNYLSPQWETLFGFHPLSSLGTSCTDYIHPDDLDFMQKSLENLHAGEKPRNKEFRHLCVDDTYIWVMATATTTSDSKGKLTGTQGILRDISEKKEMELKLQTASAQLQHITENLPCVIIRHAYTTDAKLTFLHIGPQCQQLFEVEADDVIRNPDLLLQYIDPADISRISAKFRHSLTDMVPYQIEYRVHLPQKGTRWYHSACQPIRMPEGMLAVDALITDVTKRKLAELELKNANEKLAKAGTMKDAFLANMNHELRTPLTAIMSTSEGLQRGMFGPCTLPQTEGLAVIEESSKHLLDLINELIDLSDIEAANSELVKSSIDVEDLCRSCFKLVISQAKEKSIKLHLDIPDSGITLHADEKRLRQIVVNLLQNAIKFSPEGEEITLSAIQHQPDNSQDKYIRFSVIDNGVGMEASELNTIFEPFHQVQNTLNRSYDGMGLGLALVKRYTELHSGSVGVRSAVGKGSCFYVDLPLPGKSIVSRVEKKSPSATLETPATNSASGQQAFADKSFAEKPSILLAEDNNSVAHAIKRYLEFNGFQVTHTRDGAAATQMAKETHPDIILMDIKMPQVDGLEAIRRIRRIPKLKITPIVALTGLAGDKDEQRCIDAGADHYLCKPYQMKTLVDLLEEISITSINPQPTEAL